MVSFQEYNAILGLEDMQQLADRFRAGPWTGATYMAHQSAERRL